MFHFHIEQKRKIRIPFIFDSSLIDTFKYNTTETSVVFSVALEQFSIVYYMYEKSKEETTT